jgi:quinol-cytochrome oxidoreductase complex cytochrome b subunit
MQISTGLILSCYYIPKLGIAFTCIDYIIRDIAIGWMISFLHSNGASFFLSFIYFHLIRAICYCSFQTPKHKVWYSGVVLFIITTVTAFLGYVLPWGQMSFWGATVIINFLTVIPYIGSGIANFIWGGFHVGKATITRFFSFHLLIPFFISLIVLLHIIVLHQLGPSNPLDPGNIKETIKFPYYKLKDILGLIITLTSFLEL